jgi:hypothetical protein
MVYHGDKWVLVGSDKVKRDIIDGSNFDILELLGVVLFATITITKESILNFTGYLYCF